MSAARSRYALAPLGFAMTWIDGRAGQFPEPPPAGVKQLALAMPELAVDEAPPDTIFLVMTHSHPLDEAICEAVLRREDFAYLGLIGSATKRARFVKRLGEAGIPTRAARAARLPDRPRRHRQQGAGGDRRLGRRRPPHPPRARALLQRQRDGAAWTLTRTANFMRRAVRLSAERMREGAGGPFGAIIVKDGKVIAEGWNRVTSSNDPTAHAEVTAIRAACEALGTFSLAGCDIYTSCEPCPMCLAAIYWARLDRIFFANYARGRRGDRLRRRADLRRGLEADRRPHHPDLEAAAAGGGGGVRRMAREAGQGRVLGCGGRPRLRRRSSPLAGEGGSAQPKVG